jgi:hypothetical protein
MKILGDVIERLMKSGASADEAIEAVAKQSGKSTDEVAEALKSTSDIAPQVPIGSGKNLKALQEARVGAPDVSDIDSYPKNITQDELANPGPFKLEGAPQSKDFTMPDPEAGLPVPSSGNMPQPSKLDLGYNKAPDEYSKLGTSNIDVVDYQGPLRPSSGITEGFDTDMTKRISDQVGPIKFDENPLKKFMPAATAVAAGATLYNMSGDGDSKQNITSPKQPIEKQKDTQAPVVTEDKKEDALQNKSIKQKLIGSKVTPITGENKEQVSAEQTKPEPQSPEEKTIDKYLKMMDEAEQKRQDNEFINAMYRAGIMAGSAIAGVKADYSLVDALDKLADSDVKRVKNTMMTEAEVQKLKQARKMEILEEKANDPNNPIAVKATMMMRNHIPGFPEGHSIAEIEKLTGLKVATILGYDENEKARKEAASERKELKQLEIELQQKEKEKRLDERQRKYVSDLRKETRTGELGKKYREFTKLNIIVKALTDFSKDPSGYSDYATLMGSLKALQGDESVVKEAEIRLGMDATSYFNKLMNSVEKFRTGKSLQPSQREDIIKAVDKLSSLNRNSYLEAIQPILINAEQEGIDKSLIIPPDVALALESQSYKKNDVEDKSPSVKKSKVGQQVKIRGKLYKIINENGDLEEVK